MNKHICIDNIMKKVDKNVIDKLLKDKKVLHKPKYRIKTHLHILFFSMVWFWMILFSIYILSSSVQSSLPLNYFFK